MTTTDFQVRNGLVVNSSLIIANSQTNTIYLVSNTIQVNSTILAVNGSITGNTFSGTANNSLYLGGTTSTGFQTTAGLASNVANLNANNANNLGTVAANGYVQTSQTATINTGYLVTTYNIGNNTTSTITPNAQNGNYQMMISNGAFILNTPTSDCALDLLIINGANAGTLTANGYTPQLVGGVYANTYANTASVTCNAAANPFYVTWPGHGLQNNNPVFFTAATIPNGMAGNTIYFAQVVNSSVFQLSSTVNGSSLSNTTFSSNGTTVVAYACGVYLFSIRRMFGQGGYGIL